MLKVSKARAYLHKLASAARMVQLSRMMEKVAENPPKPKGINSGVDVSKGLNTASSCNPVKSRHPVHHGRRKESEALLAVTLSNPGTLYTLFVVNCAIVAG